MHSIVFRVLYDLAQKMCRASLILHSCELQFFMQQYRIFSANFQTYSESSHKYAYNALGSIFRYLELLTQHLNKFLFFLLL
jgi:hypothetical protein